MTPSPGKTLLLVRRGADLPTTSATFGNSRCATILSLHRILWILKRIDPTPTRMAFHLRCALFQQMMRAFSSKVSKRLAPRLHSPTSYIWGCSTDPAQRATRLYTAFARQISRASQLFV